MSANIFWKPVGRQKPLGIDTPSAFIKALELPRQFDTVDIPFLTGVSRGRPEWTKPIELLIEGINQFKVISVSYED